MKKSLHAILLCLIGVCLSGSSSYASFLGDLGVIEVRGEREPRLATESALYIETFMADDLIATGKTNLSSILDSESGMQVHYAGSGTLSGLSIRGVSGGQTNNKTAVYLDGAPVSTMRRGFVLESFPAETIDRIDLIRGPASALFGDGSLNGAINITSILSRKNITNLNFHGGSFDE
ncbi:MAG: Plug domain-containing protein [Elusimicrobia bacterium]|nr:Plug domain-containing protein [Elusimicrobiota bacterium]